MITAWYGREEIGRYHTLAEAVADLRRTWCEDTESPQCFTLYGEGTYLAAMLRDQSDPEVCHVLYSDGTVEHHRCHYVTGADGMYDHTEVTELAAV